MELLERYIQEISEDLKIDELNIKDVQLRLPSRKHFWASRLIQHKIEIEKIRSKRDKMKKHAMQQIADQSPVKLTAATLDKSIDNTDEIRAFNQQIRELELVIELLEKTEKNFSSCTYDIGNIIKLMQLEQQ